MYILLLYFCLCLLLAENMVLMSVSDGVLTCSLFVIQDTTEQHQESTYDKHTQYITILSNKNVVSG